VPLVSFTGSGPGRIGIHSLHPRHENFFTSIRAHHSLVLRQEPQVLYSHQPRYLRDLHRAVHKVTKTENPTLLGGPIVNGKRLQVKGIPVGKPHMTVILTEAAQPCSMQVYHNRCREELYRATGGLTACRTPLTTSASVSGRDSFTQELAKIIVTPACAYHYQFFSSVRISTLTPAHDV
jgi:hypothetical protein